LKGKKDSESRKQSERRPESEVYSREWELPEGITLEVQN